MNIYIIIFIIIIPISIFLLTIVSDNSFKLRMKNLKREFNKLSINQNKKDNSNINSNRTQFVNTISSSFGYGRELFTIESGGVNLPNDVCNLREKSIGIKFHTFKMSKDYNVPVVDEVRLNDYCTQDYLEKNFVNVLNNIWLKSGLTFYFSDLIKEDEVDNLTKYYNFSITDQTIFPDCGDIVDFLDNPYEFKSNSRSIPEPTSKRPGSQRTDYNAGDVIDLFKYKDIPTVTTSLPKHLNGIRDEIITEEKQREMAEIDVDIFKMLTSRSGFINNDNEKKMMRNIFFRMTNEENYINDTDMHIYLVPYIHDDIALIVEGRNNRPMLLISLYYQECKKIERTIENIYSEQTRKYWLDRLVSNFKQLKDLERRYNEKANIDIVPNPNNACSAGIFDPSPSINTTLNVLRATEAVMVSEIDEIKERGITDHVRTLIDVDVDEIQKRIKINTNNMIKIYEYDYNNNHDVKMLKKYKNKRMPMVMGEDGSLQEEVYNYEQLKKNKIDELKAVHRRELDQLEAELARDYNLLKEFNIEIDAKRIPLEDVRKRIRDIIEPKSGSIDHKLLKKLKEMISKKKGQISNPMYYAEKVRPILNINRLIAGLFDHIDALSVLNEFISEPDQTLRELDKEVPICDLLDRLITDGGINVNNPEPIEDSIKEISLNANGRFKYLGLKAPRRSYFQINKYIILGPESNPETLYRESGLDKCFIYTPSTNKHNLCIQSKRYETGQLNKLDLDAQFYLTSYLLKEIKELEESGIKIDAEDKKKLNEFYEELKFKCNDCETPDYRLYQAEPNHIRNRFLTNNEAKENYEWLAGFVFKNNIKINDDFIFTNFKYLNDNSDVFDDNLVENLLLTEPALDLTDGIECDIPGNEFYERLNVTPLNDFITKDFNCGNSDYLDSFKESFF